MLFNEFAEEIKRRVTEKLGIGFQIELIECEEEDGGKELYICIQNKNEDVLKSAIRMHSFNVLGPAIRIRSLYDWFQSPKVSENFEPIVKYAVKLFNGAIPKERKARELCDNMFDFQWAKEHIMFRLLHTKRNLNLLNRLPYVPFLDLSVVFYVELDMTDRKLSKAVDRTLMDAWGVNEQALYAAALKNTQEKRTVFLEELGSAIYENQMDKRPDMLPKYEDEIGTLCPYILSNKNMCHGAATLLYPGLLKHCAESLRGDLLILPSSVHEVILIRANDEVKRYPWADIIADVNHTSVDEKDVLSDHPYLYLKEQDQMISFGISESQESAG